MTILIIWWFVGAPIYQYNCQSLSLFQIVPIYILYDCHKMYAITHRFFIHLIYLPRIVTFLFEIYSHLKFMYERLYVCKVLSLTSLDYARNCHLSSVVKPLNQGPTHAQLTFFHERRTISICVYFEATGRANVEYVLTRFPVFSCIQC